MHPVALEPEDDFWLWLAQELAVAIPPQGTFPTPSEEDLVFQRLGIRHPKNQQYARETLRYVWAGRAEGLNASIKKPEKPETPKQPKPRRRR